MNDFNEEIAFYANLNPHLKFKIDVSGDHEVLLIKRKQDGLEKKIHLKKSNSIIDIKEKLDKALNFLDEEPIQEKLL